MPKVVLEGMNRLPGRLQDLILDAGMVVTHTQNNSGSNETLASMVKNFTSLDNAVENTMKNLDRMKFEVDKLEKNASFVQKSNMELMKCRNFENRVGNYGRIFVQALVPRLEHSIA
uniref:BLOC-1-related complex subunit 7 n=1 Tax=Panagrolaimus sp. JU765 TaxID=591449 RepID=A0AC34Q1Q0_9BILA